MDSKIRKILTIGIPTYNNPKSLSSELNCIIKQIEMVPQIKDGIEILVSDNSDDEKTKELIEIILPKVPYLRYIKNEKNIGFDRNVDQLLTESTGQFCWTLSDNDLVEAGGVYKVIKTIIENPDIAHLLINTNDKFDGIKKYENAESLIQSEKLQIPGGLISSNIFNLSNLPQKRERYYNNDWQHVSLFLEICSNKSVGVIGNIFVDSTDDACRWANNGKTLTTYTNLQTIFRNLSNYNYSEGFLDAINIKFQRGLPHQVVSAKLHGLEIDKKSLRTLLVSSRDNSFVLFLSLVVLFTPSSVFRIIRKIWKK